MGTALDIRYFKTMTGIYKNIQIFVSELTIFVSQCHNAIHVISIIYYKSRQIFDINTNIWSLFNLNNKITIEDKLTSVNSLLIIIVDLYNYVHIHMCTKSFCVYVCMQVWEREYGWRHKISLHNLFNIET